MSRIFKRPMFRKGGNVMEGVMTGIQDRSNYANGPEDPRIQNSNIDKSIMLSDVFMNKYGKGGDPLAQALISGGLRAVGGAGAGKGKAAELATAFSPVVDRAFEQMQRQKDTKMGLAIELYKGMSKDDRLAFQKKAEQYAKLKGIPIEEAELKFLEQDLSETSPYLKGTSPEVRKAKIFDDITKSYQAQADADIIGMSRLEKNRVADKLDEIDQGVYTKKGSVDFIDGKYPRQTELSETEDPNIFKFKPKDEKSKTKFISGGIYYIPILDKFGTYDGNTAQFTIVE
jgi:hypothetical protein